MKGTVVLLTIAIALTIVIFTTRMPALLTVIRSYLANNPQLTIPFLILLISTSSLLFIPTTLFSILSGTLLPLPLAVLISSIGAQLGVVFAFLLIRHTRLRNFCHYLMEGYEEEMNKLSDVLERNTIKAVTLLRLTPIVPFGVGNYTLALSSITLWKVLIGTFLGGLGNGIFHSWIGSLTKKEGAGKSKKEIMVEVLMGSIALMATILATVLGKRELRRMVVLDRLQYTLCEGDDTTVIERDEDATATLESVESLENSFSRNERLLLVSTFTVIPLGLLIALPLINLYS